MISNFFFYFYHRHWEIHYLIDRPERRLLEIKRVKSCNLSQFSMVLVNRILVKMSELWKVLIFMRNDARCLHLFIDGKFDREKTWSFVISLIFPLRGNVLMAVGELYWSSIILVDRSIVLIDIDNIRWMKHKGHRQTVQINVRLFITPIKLHSS